MEFNAVKIFIIIASFNSFVPLGKREGIERWKQSFDKRLNGSKYRDNEENTFVSNVCCNFGPDCFMFAMFIIIALRRPCDSYVCVCRLCYVVNTNKPTAATSKRALRLPCFFPFTRTEIPPMVLSVSLCTWWVCVVKPSHNADDENQPALTFREIKDAIRHLKNNKAAGKDGIGAELIKMGPEAN